MTVTTCAAHYRSDYVTDLTSAVPAGAERITHPPRTSQTRAPTYDHFKSEPGSFEAQRHFATTDEAKAFAASFPKFVKVTSNGNWARFSVSFYANGVNEGKNEAGIKRLRRFLELAGECAWSARSLNSYKSMPEFLAAIEAL